MPSDLPSAYPVSNDNFSAALSANEIPAHQIAEVTMNVTPTDARIHTTDFASFAMNALSTECDHIEDPRKRQICRGEAKLPREIVDAFRASNEFGNLPPLPVDSQDRRAVRLSPKTSPVKTATNPKPSRSPETPGPGTELKKLLDSISANIRGFQLNGCGSCRAQLDLMNQLGPEGCRREFDYLVDDLQKRFELLEPTMLEKIRAGINAAREGLILNPLAPCPQLVTEAIRRCEEARRAASVAAADHVEVLE